VAGPLAPPPLDVSRTEWPATAGHSIRINDQWRVCFRWAAGDAHDVEIVDYHQESVMVRKLAPVHPGEILLKDFLEPLGLHRGACAGEQAHRGATTSKTKGAVSTRPWCCIWAQAL